MKRPAIMKRLAASDNNSEVRITKLDALYTMQQLWAKVTKATIANCFRRTKFVHNSVDNADDDVPLADFDRTLHSKYAGIHERRYRLYLIQLSN